MPRSSEPRSLVDHLAAQLSNHTGTQFTIIRVPQSSGFGDFSHYLYGLKASRPDENTKFGKFEHYFFSHRPLSVGEMKMYLATLLDMIVMGFVPVSKMRVALSKMETSDVPR